MAKLTNSSDEADLSSVLGNNAIFSVPFFQRPYKWQPRQVQQLASDILSLVDGRTDVHFLGAVIIHGLPTNPADARVYEVIDGQQRLTTLYLFVCALVRAFLEAEENDEAVALFRAYVATNIPTKSKSNLKLHPCREDQPDLNQVIQELLAFRNFSALLAGFHFVPLPGTSGDSGRISKNWALVKKFVREQAREGGVERLQEISSALLQRMSIVQIDVQDPTNGPKIFDALNSRQEPMTVGDLVRNEVFAKVAMSDPETATTVEAHEWQPFYSRFKLDARNYFDDYFFPFGLITNPNLKKSEVYGTLRTKWKDTPPSTVIEDLASYQDAFLDLVGPTNHSSLDKEGSERVGRMRRLGLPSSTYPFLMRLIREASQGSLDAAEFVSMIDVLDSFLTRRAVCGQEPTGLHAVFKRLWADLDGVISSEAMSVRIASHKTVGWPDDDEFRANVRERPIYGTAIDDYFIEQFDEGLGGDKTSDVPWIEHVLPRTYSEQWSAFSLQEHAELKDVAANLIPLSSAMNSSLGNSAYAKKRPTYLADSMFKSARDFAGSHADWTPDALSARSDQVADWAVARWPHARPRS